MLPDLLMLTVHLAGAVSAWHGIPDDAPDTACHPRFNRKYVLPILRLLFLKLPCNAPLVDLHYEALSTAGYNAPASALALADVCARTTAARWRPAGRRLLMTIPLPHHALRIVLLTGLHHVEQHVAPQPRWWR